MSAEFEVYKRDDALFDWRLKASNGRILAGSTQGYTERNDAAEGLERVVSAIVNDILELGRVEDLTSSSMVYEVKAPASKYEPDTLDETIALSVEFKQSEGE